MHHRWITFMIGFWLGTPSLGCAEAGVGFQGTVLAGDAAGHQLRDSPNPDELPPVEGAEVFFRFEKHGFYENCQVDSAATPSVVLHQTGLCAVRAANHKG
jgi:hypothetical protein